MNLRLIATDLALSTVAGHLATKVMEPVSMNLDELKPAAARAREVAAGPWWWSSSPRASTRGWPRWAPDGK